MTASTAKIDHDHAEGADVAGALDILLSDAALLPNSTTTSTTTATSAWTPVPANSARSSRAFSPTRADAHHRGKNHR